MKTRFRFKKINGDLENRTYSFSSLPWILPSHSSCYFSFHVIYRLRVSNPNTSDEDVGNASTKIREREQFEMCSGIVLFGSISNNKYITVDFPGPSINMRLWCMPADVYEERLKNFKAGRPP